MLVPEQAVPGAKERSFSSIRCVGLFENATDVTSHRVFASGQLVGYFLIRFALRNELQYLDFSFCQKGRSGLNVGTLFCCKRFESLHSDPFGNFHYPIQIFVGSIDICNVTSIQQTPDAVIAGPGKLRSISGRTAAVHGSGKMLFGFIEIS